MPEPTAIQTLERLMKAFPSLDLVYLQESGTFSVGVWHDTEDDESYSYRAKSLESAIDGALDGSW